MLKQWLSHSQPYKPPGWFSGYNEAVISTASWNEDLSSTIEAFYVLGNATGAWRGGLGQAFGSADIDRVGFAEEQHRRFLAEHHVAAEDVPLLRFDPGNWGDPFSPHT